MAMTDNPTDPATKADIKHLEEKLEAKIDGIKSWITGVAFVTGITVFVSLTALNVSIFTALK